MRLCSRAQGELWGLRIGRAYGFGIGLSYSLVAWLEPPSLGALAHLWSRSLGTASWVAGLGALSLATDLQARDTMRGLTGLARLRGFGESELERARRLSGAIRLAANVMVPGLMLALTSLLRLHTPAAALAALALTASTMPYAALVGFSLAPLARACSYWLPGRGRLLLAAITLGPWLLAMGLQVQLPSLPAGFAWVLEHTARSVH